MNRRFRALAPVFCLKILACSADCGDLEPAGEGPYAVGSTSMTVAPRFADIGDDAMHAILLGQPADAGQPRFLDEILQFPDAAWIVDVAVPDAPTIYGPASGQTLPVVVYLTFPSAPRSQKRPYAFPYHDARYGVFEDMLEPGEAPAFADADARYPLVLLAHGSSAHGIFDVGHAHRLSRHGYIVAVLFYGDDRVATDDDPRHSGFLRPLMTRAVLDAIIESDTFGDHVDVDNIGISGHSFGGFTGLALAGGRFLGEAATVHDDRIAAGVLAAPWVGGHYEGEDHFAFGINNVDLNRVTTPMISFFGTRDEATPASFILPAMQQLAGPTYVVELVGQPHVFEQGSWEDRDNWELLFLNAFLQGDEHALAQLESGRSMQGGNKDVQRFEYQRPSRRPERPVR